MDVPRYLLYGHVFCLCSFAVSAGEADFSAFGEPAAATAPADDWDAFGKATPPAVPVAAPPRLWTVNTHPGKTFTEDQLRAMYPGHRFPFDDAPAVAPGDPFAACGPGGCPTTPITSATGAGRTSTSWSGSYPAAGTFIRAGGVVTLGGTNCPTGNCPTYRRW